MILTPQELLELTARKRPCWQARELDYLHIPYRRRSDGTLIVFWDDVRPRYEVVEKKKREPQLRIA